MPPIDPTPDFIFTVFVYGGQQLNEKGMDRFYDAVRIADLEDVIHDAVTEAISKQLPDSDPPGEPMDWFSVKVEDTP
jgi:hypothetical protein